jgi:hypothetical protein
MAKIKARKVYTPGSKKKFGPLISPGRGRPAKVGNKTVEKKNKKYRARYSRVGNYKTHYEKEDMEAALSAVRNGEMSIRAAVKEFGVKRTTLQDRLSGKSGETVGRPTVLLAEEEALIVERIILMGTWGFPLNKLDVAHLIQAYLNMQGKTTRYKK